MVHLQTCSVNTRDNARKPNRTEASQCKTACPSVCGSSICLYIYLLTCLSTCKSVCLYIYVITHLSVYLCFFFFIDFSVRA